MPVGVSATRRTDRARNRTGTPPRRPRSACRHRRRSRWVFHEQDVAADVLSSPSSATSPEPTDTPATLRSSSASWAARRRPAGCPRRAGPPPRHGRRARRDRRGRRGSPAGSGESRRASRCSPNGTRPGHARRRPPARLPLGGRHDLGALGVAAGTSNRQARRSPQGTRASGRCLSSSAGTAPSARRRTAGRTRAAGNRRRCGPRRGGPRAPTTRSSRSATLARRAEHLAAAHVEQPDRPVRAHLHEPPTSPRQGSRGRAVEEGRAAQRPCRCRPAGPLVRVSSYSSRGLGCGHTSPPSLRRSPTSRSRRGPPAPRVVGEVARRRCPRIDRRHRWSPEAPSSSTTVPGSAVADGVGEDRDRAGQGDDPLPPVGAHRGLLPPHPAPVPASTATTSSRRRGSGNPR